MANLISSANFKGDIMLPNVVGSGASATQLISFITKHEARYLRDILGIELYELLASGLASFDSDFETLRDGATFVDRSDVTREWLGLNGEGTSPIANYVFYQTMRYNVSQTQGVGESMSAVENGTRASSSPKMVEAWNQMVEWNMTLHEYLMVYTDTFPEYIGVLYPPCSDSEEYNQYLFKTINTFGI